MYEWVVSQEIVAARAKERIEVQDGVLDVMTSFVWMSRATCLNESCHMYEWVLSQKITAAHAREMIWGGFG